MDLHIAKLVEIIAITGTASGSAYNFLCLWSAAGFLRDKKVPFIAEAPAPLPISLLKPLKGTDPQMYASFRSYCLQDYPQYEIIFGVSDAADPAIKLVEDLKEEFPQRRIELLICEPHLAANSKVGNLAQMSAHARYECLLVSDSDIRVGPGYLTGIMSQLQQTSVGLVTCLYRGVPASTLSSRLESIGISTDFVLGVLAARAIENGMRFGLGSTLAFRRSELAAIGGFEALADYLADDYQIGKRISDLGLKVALSPEVVETLLPHYSFAEFIRHQLRWNRTVRDSRYWGFAGLIFTFALPWVLLTDLFSNGAVWAWALTCLVLCLRLAVAIVVGKMVLEDDYALRFAWLIPLRDILAVFFWAASFAGNTVLWRGERFHLRKGKLSRIPT